MYVLSHITVHSSPPPMPAHRLYRSKNQAWLTPVEIFAPHYSHAIARSVFVDV